VSLVRLIGSVRRSARRESNKKNPSSRNRGGRNQIWLLLPRCVGEAVRPPRSRSSVRFVDGLPYSVVKERIPVPEGL
jgi:hypothetical protein